MQATTGTYQDAVALYTRRRYGEALALLEAQEPEPDADFATQALRLNLMGACLVGLGRHDEAKLAIRQALALAPGLADAHYQHGNALQGLAQAQQAIEAYRQALALDSAHLAAGLQLALAYTRLEHLPQAAQAYRQVLARRPDLAEVHNNLGTVLERMGQRIEAEAAYRQAATLRPDYAEANRNLASTLAHLGRLAEAESFFRRVVALRPDSIDALDRLAKVLSERNALPEAEDLYRRILGARPDSASAHEKLGSVLHRQDRFAEAARAYRDALAIDSSDGDAWSNLGAVLDHLDRLEEAEAAFRRALEIIPDFPDASFGLSLVLLRQGKLEEAWPLYEARYDPRRELRWTHRSVPKLECPQWRGESLAGKSLVVWQDQGHGDMVQFGRYLALLKARGVSRLTLVCLPTLAPLFARMPAVDAVVARGKDATLEDARALAGHDYWTFVMSLPLRFGAAPGSIAPAVYLRPDPERAGIWHERLAALPGRKIGLVWKGNARHSNDHNRSLPSLRALAPLWNIPNASFVSLQKGQAEDEALAVPHDQPLLHLGSEIRDFADSAALIAQLDFVI